MSLRQLNEMITKAAKSFYDNEKFAVGVLAVKARQAAESFPTDPTILNMVGFLNKRAQSSSFITRAELKDVYNRLYTHRTKFAEMFSEELGLIPEENKSKMTRDPNEGKPLDYSNLADPVLTNALASAFDKTVPYRPYSNQAAKNARQVCEFELGKLEMKPKSLQVVAGRPELLLCQASFDTPKGEAHMLIPVEMENHQALLPNMFLSTAGFKDLDKNTVVQHVLTTAGKSFQVDVQKVLEVVASVKLPSEAENEVEQFVLKASLANETPSYYTENAIVGQKIDPEFVPLQEPQYEQTPEIKAFAERLTSKVGEAEIVFGKSAVESSRNMIRQAMNTFGYSNVQVAVADYASDAIIYAVAVNGQKGFKVPVSIKNNQMDVGFIVSANGVSDFSKQGVGEALFADQEVLALASPLYGSKPSELINQIRAALDESNYLKAEDALNVLKNSGDAKAFQVGYQVYVDGLKGNHKHAASCCKLQVKVANSKYVVCGHTNLPLHKVYQDKYGDCHPLYRKAMDETYEGASFMNAKIFW